MSKSSIIFHKTTKEEEKEILDLTSKYAIPIKINTKMSNTKVYFDSVEKSTKVFGNLCKGKESRWYMVHKKPKIVKEDTNDDFEEVEVKQYPLKEELILILKQMEKDLSKKIKAEIEFSKKFLYLKGQPQEIDDGVEYLNNLFVDEWVTSSDIKELKKIVKKPLEFELSEKEMVLLYDDLIGLKDERSLIQIDGKKFKIYWTTFHYKNFQEIVLKNKNTNEKSKEKNDKSEIFIKYGASFVNGYSKLSSKYPNLKFRFIKEDNNLKIKVSGNKKERDPLVKILNEIQLYKCVLGPYKNMDIIEQNWDKLMKIINENFMIYKENDSVILVGLLEVLDLKPKIEKFISNISSKTIENQVIKSEMIKVGSIIYDKSKKLGTGGFSQVYQGFFNDDIPIAVKRIQKIESNSSIFMNEIANLKKLLSNSHENIINYRTHEQDDDFYYIAMDFCPYTLSKLNIKVSKPQKIRILYEMACGLQFLHKKGIIHRDIKPDNILLTNELKVKITDFGISKICVSSNTFYSNSGSLEWKAPECFDKKMKKKKNVDVFSLGLVFHKFYTSKHPFNCNGKSIDHNIITNTYSISKKEILFYHLIENMIKPNPIERFSMEEVLNHFFFMDSQLILSKLDNLSQTLFGDSILSSKYTKIYKDDWISIIEDEIKIFMNNEFQGKKVSYQKTSFWLLRLIRNLYHHVNDKGNESTKNFFLKFSKDWKKGILKYFSHNFPSFYLKTLLFIQENE